MYRHRKYRSCYLLLLHVEVFDDDADEEIQREKRAEDNEEDEVKIHEHSNLALRLHSDLQQIPKSTQPSILSGTVKRVLAFGLCIQRLFGCATTTAPSKVECNEKQWSKCSDLY